MTVVDVNTGKFTGSGNLEETILKTNLEAADEIVTQLRLRNIGGLIVIDFIDMNFAANRQRLSKALEKALKERDKFQSVALKVSEFGIVQMTRKRSGKTLQQQLTHLCSSCNGSGHVKSISTMSFQVLKDFKEEVKRNALSGSVLFSVSNRIFDYILKFEYQPILKLEKELSIKIILESNENFDDTHFTVTSA
jgi:ribonuclease G